MSFFQKHVFFCTNQREAGLDCCNNHGSKAMCGYAKDQVKKLGLNQPGQVRVSSAGCLGRCDEGPVLVVYPDAVWYTYLDESDIDEIISEHVVNGRVVERLRR